jgi:glycosyltransferase involved in cell wall biosynthesis
VADPKIRWLGELRWEETIAVIANADLVVVPSRANHEGIPRVCLEALALGCKVLFPAGIDEFERGNQRWVLSDTSPEAIAEAIDGALARSDRPHYDLAAHDPASVFPQYLTLYR